MNAAERFDGYLEHLSEDLGHADRQAGGNIGKARLRPEQWLLIEYELIACLG